MIRIEELLCFFFKGDLLVVGETEPRLPKVSDFPGGKELLDGALTYPITEEISFSALELSPEQAESIITLNSACKFVSLRSLFGVLPAPEVRGITLGKELLDWEKEYRYCCSCSSPLVKVEGSRQKNCSSCGASYFPPVTPAIIVLVYRQGEILLAHNKNWDHPRYSAVAGFLEPGETLEECVAREVEEETGVFIKNIRYLASQAWPFPHSIMIGFTAEYSGGDLKPDGVEIDDVKWFDPWDLPFPLLKGSLSRKLIEWYRENHGRD